MYSKAKSINYEQRGAADAAPPIFCRIRQNETPRFVRSIELREMHKNTLDFSVHRDIIITVND